MIHLLQLLNMLNKKELVLFEQLFTYIIEDIEDLGYEDFPEELIGDMIDSHFGLQIVNDRQLERITSAIIKPNSLKSAIYVTRLKAA